MTLGPADPARPLDGTTDETGSTAGGGPAGGPGPDATGGRRDGGPEAPQHVVVGPDGAPVLVDAGDDERTESLSGMVEQPAKVMRIGSMIKQLLEEVRSAPLDEASRARLKEIHARSIAELEDGLAPELTQELERLSLPFEEEGTPSDAELRIAQAQLVGWLEGLFHGIQAALVAQQMAARVQLEQIRRTPALGMAPGTVVGLPGGPGGQAAPGTQPGQAGGTGQYL